MPLDPAGLTSDLTDIAEDPPDSYSGCAQAWADAMEAYASEIVPASTTVTTAAASLKAALQSAFQSMTGVAALEAAFAAFATSVAGGMSATSPTPPPGPVGFATLCTPPFPTTHAAGGSKFAAAIDLWMKTGTHVVSGSPVFWQ